MSAEVSCTRKTRLLQEGSPPSIPAPYAPSTCDVVHFSRCTSASCSSNPAKYTSGVWAQEGEVRHGS
eukprot:1204335-Amphidinium_carterae.1